MIRTLIVAMIIGVRLVRIVTPLLMTIININ